MTDERREKWLAESLRRLSTVGALVVDWDGEGSCGTDVGIVAAAKRLLRALAEVVAEGVPPPFISPIPGGTFQLEWTVDDRYVEIEFYGASRVGVLTCDGAMRKPNMRSAELLVADVGSLSVFVDWLIL